MSDEILPGEPLQRAVEAWRRPMPVAPGLIARAQQRRIRRAVRLTSLVTLSTAAVAAIAVLWPGRRQPGITFAIDAPASRSVALVGDFTDWRSDRVKLQHESSGVWAVTLHLPPGRYRFAYLVDNTEWRADSHATRAIDDFGRPTSVITVAAR